MKVFHFAGDTLRDGSPLPQAGDELPEREPILCESGWHGCERVLDAMRYAPGSNVALRELSGTIVAGDDKACASHCRMVTGYVDACGILVEFAAWCADRAAEAARCADGAAEAAAARADARAGDPERAEWYRAYSAYSAKGAREYAESAADTARWAAESVAAARELEWVATYALEAARSAEWAVFHAREAAREAGTGARAASEAAAAERAEQEAWLVQRLLALLGQENRE